MKGFKIGGIIGLLLTAMLLLGEISGASAMPAAQIPTVDIPTVTGTPSGAMAVVKVGDQDQINVRSGPGATGSGYDIIGVLVIGQSVPALGRSVGGDWVEIAYPGAPNGVGWVYSPLVDLTGPVPIVEPPPTPTPRTTPTINPTLAAQFLVEVQPTRLPTFTPPPPVVQPTFIASGRTAAVPGRIPMGMVIVTMLVVGAFGIFISFLSSR